MKFGRIRLLVAIIAGSILMTGIIAYTMIRTVKEMNIDHLKREYNALQNTIMLQQSMIYDRLVESSYLLAENSTFKANLQLNDTNSLDYSAKDFALFMKVDLFMILDERGTIKFDLHDNSESTQIASKLPVIRKALKGLEPAIEYTTPNLFFSKDNIYQVVAVPVYAGKDKILGAIIMGVNFWDFVIKPLAKSTPFNLTLLYQNKLIGSKNVISKKFLEENRIHNSTKNVNAVKTEQEFHYFKNNESKNIAFVKTLDSTQQAELISVIPHNEVFKNNFFKMALAGLLFLNFIIAFFSWKITGHKT